MSPALQDETSGIGRALNTFHDHCVPTLRPADISSSKRVLTCQPSYQVVSTFMSQCRYSRFLGHSHGIYRVLDQYPFSTPLRSLCFLLWLTSPLPSSSKAGLPIQSSPQVMKMRCGGWHSGTILRDSVSVLSSWLKSLGALSFSMSPSA